MEKPSPIQNEKKNNGNTGSVYWTSTHAHRENQTEKSASEEEIELNRLTEDKIQQNKTKQNKNKTKINKTNQK